MDIRQLQAFIAVIDHGSFSAAANALYTVQSNVSAHVARIETELDVSLLDRRSRELTSSGRAVERRARAVLAELAAIRDDLAALKDQIIGEVTCGTTPSLGRWILPPTLAVSAAALPDVNVTIVEAQSDVLNQRLETGDVDIAITTGIAASLRGAALRRIPLFDETIVAVMTPGHHLARQPHVSLPELSEHKLLVPLPDNPLHRHLAQGFQAADAPLNDAMEVGSSNLIVAMAAAGLGVALVPATAITDNTGTVQRDITGLLPRRVELVARATPRTTTAVQAFATVVEDAARGAAATMPGCRSID